MCKINYKVIAYITTAVLIFNIAASGVSYAETEDTTSLGYEQFEGSKIEYLMNKTAITESNELLEEVIPNAEEIVESYNIENSDIMYEMDFDSEPSFVSVAQNGTDIEVSVDEGDIHNDIVITEDNEIYIDGGKVVVTEETVDETNEVTASYSDKKIYQTDPLNGKQDYIYKYSSKRANFHFEQYISVLSTVALAIALSAGPGYATASILATVAGGIHSYNEIHYKKNKNMSYIVKVYYPENGRRIADDVLLTKYVGHYYPLEDYQGNMRQKTWYTKLYL